MKTLSELKNFCEKNNVRYEINPHYGKTYDIPTVEDGKLVWKEHRTLLGYEIGMNNISGKSGKSEYQWVWFESIYFEELTDNAKFYFRERYSQLNGKSYKGLNEAINAENTIERRMA